MLECLCSDDVQLVREGSLRVIQSNASISNLRSAIKRMLLHVQAVSCVYLFRRGVPAVKAFLDDYFVDRPIAITRRCFVHKIQQSLNGMMAVYPQFAAELEPIRLELARLHCDLNRQAYKDTEASHNVVKLQSEGNLVSKCKLLACLLDFLL